MATSPGLTAKKPISVWNKPLKANFKDLFKALGKAGVDTATGQWLGLGKDAVDALSAIGLESNEPEELTWALIYNSLTKAMASLISDSQFLMQEIPADVGGVSDSLDLSLESQDLEISSRFFEHPEQLPVLTALKTPLRQWLQVFGIEPFQAEVLSNRLPAYFVFALNQEWRRGAQDYARITAAVQTPFTAASEREHGWRLYNAWLQKQIQEPMLFEAFGLEDVYVPLRGYYRRQGKGSTDGADDFVAKTYSGDREQHIRVVAKLAACLRQWLQTADKNDAIRIISGGPGSGKSSFAKIFAAQHAATAAFPVLFVPLHQFKPENDLIKAVEEFVRYDEYLKDNPLDPDDENLRLLVIFDGLDELALQGKLAKEVAQEFVREVQSKVSRFNYRKTRLQVLITGREVAVQESFKEPQQVLHVLPYFVPEAEREKENGEPYLDTAQQLAHDQRHDWWQKYGAATQQPYTAMPEALDIGNLTEITAQPLLNYLVALSYVQGKLTLTAETNLNTVYADLLNAVYERGYEDKRRHVAIGDMSKAHFVRVLEEIALAAWHGDGRTTTVEEIERHCKNSGLQRLLEIFEEGAKAGVTRLLAAFYFRQSGVKGNERTFEFTHKSFGEYLTACRIVRAMERIQKQIDRRQEDMEEGWDERDALLHWAEVCGPTRLDTYLLSFLRAEVALKAPDQVKQWQQTFAHLIEVMLRQGMPMEKVEPPLRFHQANQWAINAEEALLAVLNACARVTQVVSKIDWPSREAFGAWLKRLQGQRIGVDNVVALESLSYLHLEDAILYIQDLYGASLGRSSLMQASLVNASLVRATLIQANLVRARLAGANLERARLDRANLEGARIEGARIEGANLVQSNLTGARLDRAILDRANLEEVNLDRANLVCTSLEGANLGGANLVEAILAGAILVGANLSKADLVNISWDEDTNWEGVTGLESALNVPTALKQQLGLE
ncbi:MAG: pentapeptide repeat-containing protein [Cyanobacteria bacterium P01_F01_bin.56]